MAEFQKRKGYVQIEDPGPEIFEQYEVASWKVGSAPKIAFPVISVQESGGNRLAMRARPYRDGVKIDDIGSAEKHLTMVAVFHNSLEETGLTEINGGTSLYPDVLNKLIDTFDQHHDDAGDLVVPTRGPVRARLDTYQREEHHDERDFATLTLNFIQDNEDNVDAASFTLPSVKAQTQQVANEIEESAVEDAAWDTSLQDLADYAGQIEGLINAPQEYQRDFEGRAKILTASIRRVFTAFMQNGVPGRDLFKNSNTSGTQRSLVLLQDMVGRETIEARRGRPQLVSVAYSEQRTLMSIAAEHGQSYEDLLEVNSQLEDPMAIAAGDVVRIFADGSS